MRVLTRGKTFTLSPGTELLLTRNTNVSFSQLNPNASIPYDHLKVSKVAGDTTAFACNFTLSSALIAIPMIRTLSASTDPAETKALSKLVKDAAILADSVPTD